MNDITDSTTETPEIEAPVVEPQAEDIVNSVVAENATTETPEIEAPSPEVPALPTPESEIIFAVKSNPDFINAIDSSIEFLNLADLDPIRTVDSLRGLKESQIRDKIQLANSVLVLLANYGSDTDNKELVNACIVYAEKMQIIIKRLCL